MSEQEMHFFLEQRIITKILAKKYMLDFVIAIRLFISAIEAPSLKINGSK